MALKFVLLLLITIPCFMSNATTAREVPTTLPGGFNLSAMLDNTLVDCFNALSELKSCSNEIVLYFMNGETKIGPACCKSITMITHHCWPAMLTSLGFTAQQGDILRGYCDAFSAPALAPVGAPSAHI